MQTQKHRASLCVDTFAVSVHEHSRCCCRVPVHRLIQGSSCYPQTLRPKKTPRLQGIGRRSSYCRLTALGEGTAYSRGKRPSLLCVSVCSLQACMLRRRTSPVLARHHILQWQAAAVQGRGACREAGHIAPDEALEPQSAVTVTETFPDGTSEPELEATPAAGADGAPSASAQSSGHFLRMLARASRHGSGDRMWLLPARSLQCAEEMSKRVTFDLILEHSQRRVCNRHMHAQVLQKKRRSRGRICTSPASPAARA